jgi:PKD repeat protein
MSKVNIRLMWSMVLWLCFGFAARAQTSITINGPDPSCKGAQALYSVTATNGLVYTWSVTSQGNLLNSQTYGTISEGLVGWGSPGLATVTVTGKNSSGTIVELGNKTVNVLPLPQPVLTWDAQVGCQIQPPRKDKEKDSLDVNIEEGGCIKVCEGSVVTYTASGGAGSTYTWQIAGGTGTASGNVFTAYWGSAGSGSISVTETNAAGCVGTKTICIEIIKKPKASFYVMSDPGSDPVSACVDDVLVFVNQSVDNGGSPIVSYYWNFGDNSTSTQPNPTHAYTNSGGYEVILTVTNACGCTSEYVIRIEVKEKGVKIECPSVVCENSVEQYSVDQSVCPNAQWEVIGGTPLNGLNSNPLQVQWDQVDDSGFGYVIFDAAAGGCDVPCPAKTVVKIPVIKNKGFIDGPTTICALKQFRYKLPQWPATQFNWSIVPGSTGAVLVYTDQPNEVLITGYAGGVVKLKCAYENTILGCGGRAELDINVLPAVSINGPDKVCANSNTNVYALSAYSGTWVLTGPGGFFQTGGGSTFTPTFAGPGQYTLNVSGPFCPPNAKNITVLPVPSAPNQILGPAFVCPGMPATYTAQTGLPGTAFEWTIVGGTLSTTTGATVTATFTGAGPWSISVSRRNVAPPNCAGPAITKVVSAPVANVNITGNAAPCANSTQTYNANYNEGEVYTWSVFPASLGSVVSSAVPTASILWNDQTSNVSGFVIVKVRKCGIEKIDSHAVTVQGIPNFAISSPSPVCGSTPVSFSLSPAPSSGTVAWNFGDGNTGSGLTASNTYTNNSTGSISFVVSATITNANGCVGTKIANKTIVVEPTPKVLITPSGTIIHCAPGPYADVLNANVTTNISSTMFRWYKVGTVLPVFSGAPPAGATYTATTTGQYYVEVTSANGCVVRSNTVTIVYDPSCGTASCTPIGSPSVSTSTLGINCGVATVLGTASAGGSGYAWSAPQTIAFSSTGAVTSSTATATYGDPGDYPVTYSALYPSTTVGVNCKLQSTQWVRIPLIAGLRWVIDCIGSPAGQYHVRLWDNSSYHPAEVGLTQNTWQINGGTVINTGTTSFYDVNLPAGTYTVVHTVKTIATGVVCTVTKTFTLAPLPVAAFSAAYSSTCSEVPIQLTNTSSGTYSTAYWSFGDGTFSNVNNPSKAWNNLAATPALNTVTLTVTNQYGCVSSTAQTITVNRNNLGNPTITGAPTNVCLGSPITLTYNVPGGATTPNAYTWIEGQNNILNAPPAAVPTYNVFEPGGYWASVSDAFRCKASTPMLPVNFVGVPEVSISGDFKVCYPDPLTVYGYAGPGITSYNWYIDGSFYTTTGTPTLSISALSVGTHTCSLTVNIPKPGGGFCVAKSGVYNVSVNAKPPVPSISFNMKNCDFYEWSLSANTGVPGTYTWSNGMFGSGITVYEGGPYRVYFTDVNGCTSTNETDLPKDPEVYMWVFPTGCYEFCYQELPKYVYGPVPPFDKWEWWHNGGILNSGGPGVVPPLEIKDKGTYNMGLYNGYCYRKSGDMDVSLQDCPCPFEWGIKGINYKQMPADMGGGCAVYIDFFVHNPLGIDVPFTITSDQGFLMPSSGILMNGPNGFTMQFSANPGFTGGPVTFYITGTDPKSGKRFYCEFRYDLRPCQGGYARNTGRTEEKGVNSITNEGNNLQVAPNPARTTATLSYHTVDSEVQANRTIEVYDYAGRKVAHFNLDKASGSVTLDTQAYPAGMYLIVLMKDGQQILHSKLSVIH